MTTNKGNESKQFSSQNANTLEFVKANPIIITNHRATNLILQAFGDEDKRNILNLVGDDSHRIIDILKQCKIPQTSGYRMIRSLIEAGLLVKRDGRSSTSGRKIRTYHSLFRNVRVEISKNHIIVKAQFTEQ